MKIIKINNLLIIVDEVCFFLVDKQQTGNSLIVSYGQTRLDIPLKDETVVNSLMFTLTHFVADSPNKLLDLSSWVKDV